MKFEIVVAKYREDTSWTANYSNVVIYTKNKDIQNVGREASTYLHHMITRFESLADRTLFVQGSPFIHHLDIEKHSKTPLPFCSTGLLRSIPFDDMTWTSDIHLNSALPHELRTEEHKIKKKELETFWDDFISRPKPQRLRYNWGAQFSVTRQLIRRLGMRKLTHMYEWCCSGNDYYNAVTFEIMWAEIFK